MAIKGVWRVSSGCLEGVQMVYNGGLGCLWVSLGCLEGVLGVINTYKLTKSKMALEVIWRVAEECLGVSGGCLAVS